jgi:hypothetical protein
MVFAICLLAIFIPTGTYLTMVIRTLGSQVPTMFTMMFDYFFHGIPELVLLPMLTDYINGCTRSRSFDLAAQIKILGEPSLVFIGLRFGIYIWLLFR